MDILLTFNEFLYEILENILVNFLLRVLKYRFENVLKNFWGSFDENFSKY